MNIKFCLPFSTFLLLSCLNVSGQPPVNRSLSNLTVTAINASLVPGSGGTLNLGSADKKWNGAYISTLIFADGTTQATAIKPYTSGTGISIVKNQIINTAPDKTVTIAGTGGITVTGTYPNFTVSGSTGGTGGSQWTTVSKGIFYSGGNVGIGTINPLAKLHVIGGDALINGVTAGLGSGGDSTNLAVGKQPLLSNTTGFANMAFGNYALYSNTTGYDNLAIGDKALYSNTDGLENTALGNGTLYYNAIGTGNTAVGNSALRNNGILPNEYTGPDASFNTANGFYSLLNNTSGYNNAAFGSGALLNNTTGSSNTAIGANSNTSNEDFINATAIGANSLVNDNNKIRLGDVNVTVVESAAGSWTTSDGRFKTNIQDAAIGLDFIKLLRPVVYNFDASKFDDFLSRHLPDSVKIKRKAAFNKAGAKPAPVLQTGFIAQEVADAARTAGYNFSGVHAPANDDDNYSLSYEKLVVPLVKAVQELSEQNELMKKQIELLQAAVKGGGVKNTTLITPIIKLPTSQLYQNVPNPARGATTIGYNLPLESKTAELIITDNTGIQKKRVQLTGKGKGSVELNTSGLGSGTYQYSLVVDGNVSESRQLIIGQ